MRRFFIYLALVIGSITFAFPFFWLLSTSFKGDKEIGVFPPRWIPKVPWYSVKSPFISGNAYEEMKKPDALKPNAWNSVRAQIEDVLWQRAQKYFSDAQFRFMTRIEGHEHLRTQMVRGLWEQVKEIVPEQIWQQPNELPDFVAKSVTDAMLLKAVGNVQRVLAFGAMTARDLRNDNLPFTHIVPRDKLLWNSQTPQVAQVAQGETVPLMKSLEKQPFAGIAYDLQNADGFTLTKTFRLPKPLPQLAALNLPVRCDETWHRMTLTLENGGKVYVSQRPQWMDIPGTQDMEWIFKEPSYRGSRSIVLKADSTRHTDVSDPHVYKVTIHFTKSSRARAAFDKYFNSYRLAVSYVDFWLLLRNTLRVVLLNVLGHALVCSLVAYGFARLKFYGRDVLFGLVLATMMLPADVTRIPHFILMKYLGWYDTLKPLWVGAWFGSPFFIFLLRQFFLTIPKELEDAAKIDGCNHWGIYWRVMLPLVKPALATVAIFTFMGSWNDFGGPLIYLSSSDNYTMAYGLYQFRTEHSGEWGMMMAAATMMVLPIITLFFFCQRYMIQGVTLTGLKG
jgi:multiple sugar transport system permease protein